MKKSGFTLAEILITLTIIGIIATIVIPSLMADINEKAWDTQRKALHARLSQALVMLPQLGGYGTYKETTNAETGKKEITENTAEAFVSEGLNKVYKITNICKKDKLNACGISNTYKNYAGTASVNVNVSISNHITGYDQQSNVKNTDPVAFTTKNDESILVYYNPECAERTEGAYYSASKACANFIYDLNGTKGPNQTGKDVGVITAFYNHDPEVVAPLVSVNNIIGTTSINGADGNMSASELCAKQNSNSRLPDRDELSSIYINRRMFWTYGSGLSNGAYLSGTPVNASNIWINNNGGAGASGYMTAGPKDTSYGVICVKK